MRTVQLGWRARVMGLATIGALSCGTHASGVAGGMGDASSATGPDGSMKSHVDGAKDAKSVGDAMRATANDAMFVSHDAGSNCGGRTGNPCGDGAKCTTGTDCQSGLCTGGVCVAPPATCGDGKKDGTETDVDCGGSVCPPCGTNKDCVKPTDCVSAVCTGGMCQAATDTDNVKNDSETDVDCGGQLQSDGTPNPSSDGAPACAVGKLCALPTDCTQGVCTSMLVVDGGVSDAALPSSDGATDGGVGLLYCQPASASDGVQNDSETDIDCGGGFLANGMANPASDGATVCQHGQACVLGTDCGQGVCNANMDMDMAGPINCPNGTTGCTCQVPWPDDGVKNDGETDVDCGGGTSAGSDGAATCGTGLHCKVTADCTSLVCTAGGLCAAPTPTDGVQNGGETDVDCGGSKLASGAPNTGSDGAPPCVDAKMCGVDTDCLSAFCSTITNRCVDGQSCKGLITPASIMDISAQAVETIGGADAVGVPDPNGAGQNAGLDTCGAGESTDPPGIQSHESCCKSLLIPNLPSCSSTKPCPTPMEVCSSTTTAAGTCQLRMDKYAATTGRVRQFVESVNAWSTANGKGPYNMQAWVEAQLAAPMTPIGVALSQMIPTSGVGATNVVPFYPTGDTTQSPPTYLNVVAQLGGTTIDRNHPSGLQGCYIGEGASGASTYWWPSEEIAGVGSPPRPVTQDYYDIKPQNCAPYWIGAAFCAWDGGRLATQAESNAVYGTAAYPWGNTLYPNPYPAVTSILANGEAADTTGIPIGTFIPGNPNVPGAPGYTVNFCNADGGSAGGNADFYFYPSYPLSNPSNGPLGASAIPDTLSNVLDLSVYNAAPGRFIRDLTSAKSLSTGNDGWMDWGANMMSYLMVTTLTGNIVSNYNDTTQTPNVVLGASMIGVTWEGGDWECHGVQPGGYNEPMQTQYGSTGFRCVRPPEPAP